MLRSKGSSWQKDIQKRIYLRNILGRLIYLLEWGLGFPQMNAVLINPNSIKFWDISPDPANSELASYIRSLEPPAEVKHSDVVLFVYFHIIVSYA